MCFFFVFPLVFGAGSASGAAAGWFHRRGAVGRRFGRRDASQPSAQARHAAPSQEQTHQFGRRRQRQSRLHYCTGLTHPLSFSLVSFIYDVCLGFVLVLAFGSLHVLI